MPNSYVGCIMHVMTITSDSPGRALGHGQSRLKHAQQRTEYVIEALGSGANLAKYLGVNRSQPAQWRKGAEIPGPGTSRILLDLDYVIARASMLWPTPVVNDWLTGNNSFLNGARPIDVIKYQGVGSVIEALDAELSGAYA